MKKGLVQLILFSVLIPFLSFAQMEKQSGFEQNKQSINSKLSKSSIVDKENAANAQIGANRFYAWQLFGGVVSSYTYSFTSPNVNQLLVSGIPEDNQYVEGTFDENGGWWGLNFLCTRIIKMDPSDGTVISTFNPGLVGPMWGAGIAYNPVDKQVYFLVNTGMARVLYKFNPVTHVVSAPIITYIDTFSGLACSKDGELYTLRINNADGDPIIKLSTVNPALNTVVGQTLQLGTFRIGGYVELETDLKTNKIYMATQNAELFNRAQIREVNTNTGATSLYYSFADGIQKRGLSFSYKLLLLGLEEDDVLNSNTSYDIEWIGGDNYNVKLEFSSDNGATWSTIATDIPSAVGFYSWNVPNISSTSCLLRITDLSDATNTKTSPLFEIFKPFQLITGNGGESWLIGSQQTISWTSNFIPSDGAVNGNSMNKKNGIPDQIFAKLEYSSNGINGPWVLLANNINCSLTDVTTFLFTVPAVITNKGLFKLTSMWDFAESENGQNQANDHPTEFIAYSDNFWSTYKNSTSGKMLITSPNGGEELNAGEYKYISWIKTGGTVSGTTYLEYSVDGGLTWIRINSAPIAGIMRYSWKVPNVNSNKCLVRMCNYLTKREIDRSDSYFTISNTGQQAVNYPNPFNPSTKIMFRLDKSEMTSLKIYNSIGQEVAMLVNKQLEAGSHSFEFNAANLPSGVYFYNLNRGGKTEIHKMMLLK